MNEKQARDFVVSNVEVGHQEVVLMKSLLLAHYQDNCMAMLEEAILRSGATKPTEIILHATVDPVPALKQFAEWISWSLAGCEALWGLVHSGVLIQNTFQLDFLNAEIRTSGDT